MLHVFHYTQAGSNRLQPPTSLGLGRVGLPRQMRTLNVHVALPHDRRFYDKKPDQPDPLSTIPSCPNSCRGQIAKDGPDHWAGPPDQLRIFGPVFDRFDAMLTPATSVREDITDRTKPLYITEGSKKADALASRGCCTVGLLGVYGWRGKDAQGNSLALGDWEDIALNERDVYIVFDSDVMVNPMVHGALRRLSKFLETRRARVWFIYRMFHPNRHRSARRNASSFNGLTA